MKGLLNLLSLAVLVGGAAVFVPQQLRGMEVQYCEKSCWGIDESGHLVRTGYCTRTCGDGYCCNTGCSALGTAGCSCRDCGSYA